MSRCWTFLFTTMLQQPNLFVFFNVVVFLTVVFHKFSSESVAFNVFPGERCHCWCWRQSERHSGIPSTPLLPSVCPRNSSVRRRCSDTDLEEKPHSCHIACCRVPICVSTFFFYILISVYAVFPPRRTGPWSGTTSSQKEDDGHGVRGGRVGVYSALASGASSRVVRPSGDCSSLWWCLASYNLQNAHPFAEVWWMGGGGGGVEWKGRGMVDYSDTYRKGGSGVSWVNKKKKAQHWGHVLVISTGSLYLKEVIMCFLGSYVVIWSVISFAFKRSAKWKKTKVNAKGS